MTSLHFYHLSITMKMLIPIPVPHQSMESFHVVKTSETPMVWVFCFFLLFLFSCLVGDPDNQQLKASFTSKALSAINPQLYIQRELNSLVVGRHTLSPCFPQSEPRTLNLLTNQDRNYLCIIL